jgi:fatty acid desaturase
MHAGDDTPLSMYLIDTAVVRGAIDARNDERFVRGRIAVFAAVFGNWALIYAAAATWLWPIAAIGVPLLTFGAWLYAERPGLLFKEGRDGTR